MVVPNPPAKPGFQASRVVGSPSPASRGAVVPRARAPGWSSPTEPGFGAFALAGLFLVGASIAGLLLTNLLPWVHPAAGDDLSRSDIHEDGMGAAGLYWDDSIAYTKELTRGPVLDSVLVGLLAFLLILLDVIPGTRLLQSLGRLALTAGLALFSLRLLIASTRWFGLYLSNLMNIGEVGFHLHVGLYGLLVESVLVTAASLFAFARSLRPFLGPSASARHPGAVPLGLRSVGVAASVLVLAPLLPLASDVTEDANLSEVELTQFAHVPGLLGGSALRKTADDLSTIRLMLWIVLGLSGVALAAGLLDRAGGYALLAGTLLQAYAFNLVLVTVGAVFTGLLYFRDLGQIELFAGGNEFRPVWNWFPPLGWALLALLGAGYVLRILVPFVREAVQRTRPESSA